MNATISAEIFIFKIPNEKYLIPIECYWLNRLEKIAPRSIYYNLSPQEIVSAVFS